MRRIALTVGLTAVFSLIGMGTASADHREGAQCNTRSTTYTTTYTSSRRDGRRAQVCETARFHRQKVRQLDQRVYRLKERYEYERNHYGWQGARHTYHRMQRVQQKLGYHRAQARTFGQYCRAAQRRTRRSHYSHRSQRSSSQYSAYDHRDW